MLMTVWATPEKATASISTLLHKHNSHPKWHSAMRSLLNSLALPYEMTIIIKTRQSAAKLHVEPWTAQPKSAKRSQTFPGVYSQSYHGNGCCQACLCVCLQYKSVSAHLSKKQDINTARRGWWEGHRHNIENLGGGRQPCAVTGEVFVF